MDITRTTILLLALVALSACGRAAPRTVDQPEVPASSRFAREYRTLRGDRDELESQGWHTVERAKSEDGVVRWVAWRYQYE